MGRLLVIGTHGSDDPTKAVLPLLDAKAAIDARHGVALELKGEGTYLIKDVIAENVKAVGWGTAKEALGAIYAAKIPVYVWGGWARARGLADLDLAGRNIKFITPAEGIELLFKYEKVIVF